MGYILEGTVQRERPGDPASRIRIIPQLIKVSDNTHLWAETYDDQMSEVFQLQSDIAERVATELEVTLLGTERSALEKPPTQVPEAAELYLSASGYSCIHPEEHRTAVQLLERATELDSSFALAFVRLSEVHDELYFWGFDRTEERLSKARSACGV